MAGVKRDLWRSCYPNCPLKQVMQDLDIQVVLEYLQSRKLYNLPAQPVPVLSHPQSKEGVSLSWCQSFL